VVVNHLNVVRVTLSPPKAQAPLVVDPDTPLPRPISAQFLQAISRRRLEILKRGRCIQYPEFPESHSENVRPPFTDRLTMKESLCVAAPKVAEG